MNANDPPLATAILREMAASRRLLIVSHRYLARLVKELGDEAAALRFLIALATETGVPLGYNVPAGAEGSLTYFVAPRDWTPERLAGYVAAQHAEIEELLGPVASVRPMVA
jgi:hypothetical protein